MIQLTYSTIDGSNRTETFNTIEEAAENAVYQLGSWDRGWTYIVGEFGDCKISNITGSTLEQLENKMKQIKYDVFEKYGSK